MRAVKLHATLIVKRLPSEYNTIDRLNAHFKSFGTIVNVKVNIGQGRNSALIQFSCDAEAKAALDDPKPLFDNRHITVETATEADSEAGARATAPPTINHGQRGSGPVAVRPPKVQIPQGPQAFTYRKPTELEAKTKAMRKQRETIVAKIQALKVLGKPTAEAEQLLESVDRVMGTLFKDAKPVTPKDEVKSIRLENVDHAVTREHLAAHFDKFGQSATVTQVEGQKGRYLVEFAERRFAAAAVKHGGTLDGSPLLMFWHNPTSS